MTTTPTPAPPASPERPSLVAEACRPDIRVRLQDWRVRVGGVGRLPELAALLKEARAVIKALREMNQRHCDDERLLKEARARIAELEAGRG